MCLLIFAMGYLSGGFFVVLGLFEVGVVIYALQLKTSLSSQVPFATMIGSYTILMKDGVYVSRISHLNALDN